MENLLIGNGVNINFSGNRFTNASIIQRALINTKLIKTDEDYPKETTQLLEYLYGEFKNTINGINNQFLYMSYDKEVLEDFIARYINRTDCKIFEIGLEDYFILYEIFSNKHGWQNPTRYLCRESLKRMLLDSIYMNGQIQKIWKKFPKRFIGFLNDFNNIFTTNYDNNLESCVNKTIYHLHGCFSELDDKYNPNSFRNHLEDMKGVDYSYVRKHPYLYSTSLFSYCGSMKEFSMKQPFHGNTGIEKFASAFSEGIVDPFALKRWCSSTNQMLHNLGESIKLKQEHPEYMISEPYRIREFQEIKKDLSIIGLSPSNDNHIFKWINDNHTLDKIHYFYFNPEEIAVVKKLLISAELIFKDVKALWRQLDNE